MRSWLVFIFLTIQLSASAEDTTKYSLYRDRVVLFGDVGFNAAPFWLYGDFNNGVSTLRYKHNLKAVAGLGIMYKWLSLRIGFGIPGNLRPQEKFGTSKYLDLGFSFSTKRVFWDFDFRNYSGYVIKNAKDFDTTYNEVSPHAILPNTRAVSASMNAWYFFSDDVKMPAIFGKRGHYEGEVKSWYLKNTLNYHGVGNDSTTILLPSLIDSTNTKTSANSISAVDIGVIPGYVYVNRINNIQFSVFTGVGAVVQSKFYRSGSVSRGFLGLAPRIDLRFIAGYSKPGWFAWFVSDFDIKSIQHQDLFYNQFFYSLKLVAGVRLKTKKSTL